MRIVVIGAVEFSARVLARLIERRFDVVGVCTLHDSRINADHADLSTIAGSAAIPWRYCPDINGEDSIVWIREQRPEVILGLGWSRLFSQELLDLAPHGVIGFHPTMLPQNRGRHPLIWALVLGLKQTGVTFFQMVAEADAGDILFQTAVPIYEDDDARSLYDRICDQGMSDLCSLLPLVEAGTVKRTPQAISSGNSWRKRTVRDGQIDWRMSAAQIHDLVRALSAPYVGAHFVRHGVDIKVWRAQVVRDVPENLEPGKILAVSGDGVVVKCGQNGLRILEHFPPSSFLPGEYL